MKLVSLVLASFLVGALPAAAAPEFDQQTLYAKGTGATAASASRRS